MNVERLLNLMLHSRQKRELPFWTGEITEVLGAGWGVAWEVGVGLDLSGRWGDSIFTLRTSGTGDKVREGALGGDSGRGEPAEGDPPPAEGLPFTRGETGDVVPLLV